tara:strand:+ start:45 stop:614 length:570 start_codon:yes stop_codon:yes gene_type:complete
MYYYTYITKDKRSDKFYIGSHSTKDLDDGYQGSGRWVKSVKDKTRLKTKIIEFYNSTKQARLAEKKLIKENFKDKNNMNWIYGTNGITDLDIGERNPHFGKKQSEHQKKVVSEYMKKNNPMFKKENIKSMLGNVRAANRGIEGRQQSKNLMNELNSILKTCKHCDKQVYNHGSYHRWHGDNCRERRIAS